MPDAFKFAVTWALTQSTTKYLILGDATHGQKSLACLAKAQQDGALKLKELGVKTILFEGSRSGHELTAENGVYNGSVTALRGSYTFFPDITVKGCENDQSLATEKALNDWMMNPESGPQPVGGLDKRIPDANGTWFDQMVAASSIVVLCCGTSHLPAFNHAGGYGDTGLVARLSQRGGCIGYAVEAPNGAGAPNMYFPEVQQAGLFGSVKAIDAYPGWNTL